MSSLTNSERITLEKFLEMSVGYVLNFSDRTFGDFVLEFTEVDIHSEKYTLSGTSKANKLRTFWKLESDSMVAKLLLALIEHQAARDSNPSPEAAGLANKCRQIASRLQASSPILEPLKQQAKVLDANHLADQIRRAEESVEKDPSLAIGTAKELIETCCKTILAERGKPVSGMPDISTLTKETLKELKLVPDAVPDASRGADVIKRLLSNLGTIGHGLSELRNLYGTGHGKTGKTSGLSPRHARLAVGAAATLTTFLFQTHQETKT